MISKFPQYFHNEDKTIYYRFQSHSEMIKINVCSGCTSDDYAMHHSYNTTDDYYQNVKSFYVVTTADEFNRHYFIVMDEFTRKSKSLKIRRNK